MQIKPTVLFFYNKNNIGGAELLIAKIAKQFTTQDYKVCLVCLCVSDEMKRIYIDAGLRIIYLKKWLDTQSIKRILAEFNEPRCITFFWTDFMTVSSINCLYKKTLLYAIHYHAISQAISGKFKIFLSLLILSCINNAISDNKIVCMDEMTINEAIFAYGEKNILAKELAKTIVRIPVDIPKVSKETLWARANSKEFRILAIARADFPFKGYLVGLVDKMREYIDKDIKLDIVTYGADEKILYGKLKELPAEVQNNITIYGKTEYEQLEPLFEKAKLYVGMGTTLIDASARGLLSIPIEAYTYSVKSYRMFYEDYRQLGGTGENKNCFDALLSKVYNFTPKEYLEKSQLSIQLVKQHYSSEMTAKKLLAKFVVTEYDKQHLSIVLYNVIRNIYTTTKKIFNRKTKYV